MSRASIEARNEANDAGLANLNGGPLRFYNSGGSRPASPAVGFTGTLLAVLTFNATAFGASVNGVATANAITPGTAIADGEPDYARGLKVGATDPTDAVFDWSVSCKKDATLDATANTVLQNNHGRANGTAVVLGGTLTGTGLTGGTVYYVVTSNTNDHQLALTPGGSAIDITAVGSGVKIWRDAEIVLEASTIASGATVTAASFTHTMPVGT